jgi:hypothetical protein
MAPRVLSEQDVQAFADQGTRALWGDDSSLTPLGRKLLGLDFC